MLKIDFLERIIKLLAEYSDMKEEALWENWRVLRQVHGYNFNRAVTDLVSSSIFR